MIDLKDLREHPELYKKNTEKKGKNPDLIKKTLAVDEKWRRIKKQADDLRAERNSISEAINQAKKNRNESQAKQLILHAQEIPEKLKNLEEQEAESFAELGFFLKEIPNLMHPSVPKGTSDKDNKVRKKVGRATKLKFKPKTHVEIIESLDIGDFDASAKVAGNGFYYLKNDLGLLNQALIQFAIDHMTKKRYTYIEPPLMESKKIAAAAGDLNAFKNALYKIESEDLYMIPTAEHAILGMMSDKTIPEENLPLKFFGYSMSLRKEIGAHGINEKGLWRTHQFNKVEQFIFCKPKDSEKLYDELLENTEGILKSLELPYHIIEICTGDLADWKYRSADFEVWRPTTNSYGETMSLTNCTDFQARNLGIKCLDKEGNK